MFQFRPVKKIYSVIAAKNEKYFIASFGDGFFIYDKKQNRIYNKKIYPEHSDTWHANKVTTFLKISDR